MCEEVQCALESLIKKTNLFIDEAKEMSDELVDYNENFQNVESQIIDIAQCASEYRSFIGTNTHLLSIKIE